MKNNKLFKSPNPGSHLLSHSCSSFTPCLASLLFLIQFLSLTPPSIHLKRKRGEAESRRVPIVTERGPALRRERAEWGSSHEEAANQLEAGPNQCSHLYQWHKGFQLVNDPQTMTFFVSLLFRVEGMGILSWLIFAIFNSPREVHTYFYLPVIRGICYSGAFKDCLIFLCVCMSV